MEDLMQKPMNSKAAVWTGRVASALPVVMLCVSASMKLTQGPKIVEMMDRHLGYSPAMLVGLAVVELSCVLLYVIPWTSVTGAILITGYMGGAIASHVRVGDPPYLQIVLPILVWLGLWLREPRLRAILPWRG